MYLEQNCSWICRFINCSRSSIYFWAWSMAYWEIAVDNSDWFCINLQVFLNKNIVKNVWKVKSSITILSKVWKYSTSFLYSIYSTHKTYVEWQASPTITTINTTAYPIKSIEFPAITICSQGSAKNVMDAVILRQFEEYLKVRGIKEKETKKTKRSTNNNQGSVSPSPSIHSTLSKEEVM